MSTIRTLAIRRTPFILVPRAAFSNSIARRSGKESSLHNEGRAEEIEKHKNDQLNKKKTGDQHWEEGLASDSESAVKADRSETGKNTTEQIKKLQDETKKV